MYKHLLIAFDGSELSDKALRQGIELAKAVGAKITVLYVTMPWSNIAVGEIAVMFPPEEYETNAAAAANEQLKRAGLAAREAGVSCEQVHSSESQPYKAIVDTAAQKGCDLIVMGSHGRRGMAGLLLGSVATKTLTHAHVPVLVYRE
jgi:nucleotide-binding universal stress UspA family protein